MIESRNPATGDLIEVYEPWTASRADTALERAMKAQSTWAATPVDERSARFLALAELLRKRCGTYARMITDEMGKPIVEAEAEIEKCAGTAEHYAAHARAYLAPEPVDSGSVEAFVAFEPMGLVLAIMPWNYPFWQVIRAGLPILTGGNGLILKHASNVTGCALAVEQLFLDAGFPEGLLQAALLPGRAIEPLIADHRIRAVTLTGSSDVGAQVAAIAGRHLKKQVLELGGSDPCLILADADLSLAVAAANRARNQNSGQSCIAAKRFIVERSIAEDFTERLSQAVDALRVGDPRDRATQVGPLARLDLRNSLARQVDASITDGATRRTAARDVGARGAFYAPTVLGDVTDRMTVFREETFGPVAAVIVADGIEQAISLANDTPYGLGASIWTADLERARHLASRLQAGSVVVNGIVASDARMPMGGIKQSGYGRELGRYGVLEFVNIQAVRLGSGRPA